jgi:hypothetical protein
MSSVDHQTTHQISLPALQGNNTLGFLAALGVVQLCAHFLDDKLATLGWPNGPTGAAVLSTSRVTTINELSGELTNAANRLKAPHLVVEGVPFPPNAPGTGAGTDPVRQYSFDLGRVAATEALTNAELERWLTAVVALDEPITAEKRNGSLPVTPFAARGPGTVMLARTLNKLQFAAAQPPKMLEALTFWVREDTIAGYIDPQAKRNASYQASSKDHDNYGALAPAWLAMMSMPFFPALSNNADVAIAPGWSRPPKRQSVFRWPVWTQQLSCSAISVLLSHPAVMLPNSTGDTRLLSMGVAAVYESERSVEGNNDGPMTQALRIWPIPQGHNE